MTAKGINGKGRTEEENGEIQVFQRKGEKEKIRSVN